MKNEPKYIICASERVYRLRLNGAISGGQALARIRNIHILHPDSVTFSAILDFRSWIGLLVDDDLKEHYNWIRRFREANGIEPDLRGPVVYLIRENSSAHYIAQQMAALRGREVSLVQTASEAWNFAAPGSTLPDRMRAFLK
jgi:hypothetical protein